MFKKKLHNKLKRSFVTTSINHTSTLLIITSNHIKTLVNVQSRMKESVSSDILGQCVYMDSPPSKSPGKNELRLEGVALAGSALSMGAVPQRLADVGFGGQPVLQVSAAVVCLLLLRQAPVEAPC